MISMFSCGNRNTAFVYFNRRDIFPLVYVRVSVTGVYYGECVGYYISRSVTVGHDMTAQMFKRHLQPLFRPASKSLQAKLLCIFIGRKKFKFKSDSIFYSRYER